MEDRYYEQLNKEEPKKWNQHQIQHTSRGALLGWLMEFLEKDVEDEDGPPAPAAPDEIYWKKIKKSTSILILSQLTHHRRLERVKIDVSYSMSYAALMAPAVPPLCMKEGGVAFGLSEGGETMLVGCLPLLPPLPPRATSFDDSSMVLFYNINSSFSCFTSCL